MIKLIKFCEFIKKENHQISWRESNNKEYLFVWLPISAVNEFYESVEDFVFDNDEGGIDAKLQDDCICFNLIEILDCYDIDPIELFPKEEYV